MIAIQHWENLFCKKSIWKASKFQNKSQNIQVELFYTGRL